MAPKTEDQERVAVVAVIDVKERVVAGGGDIGTVATDTVLDGLDEPAELTAVT